ncbi:hypothetical protein GCM10025864_08260 [Luteimicrobium album]|uniref:DUF2510 domain-containing protein n=1 Tax=Luteimicrobium album TaxID=1054550 RepID=A0ABQ6HXE6_9MICO|nr:DUF2510 domain-containing protein [Luteimicrobium album]GMA23067.1 hypothetical protein GCM10025864_08260 [Luteimicrobium album]
MTVPAPGWYPDPYRPGMLRWFDGHGWTEHVAPLPAASHPGADPFESPPIPPGGAATVSPTPRRLTDHVRALIALGALAVVVLVCALGAVVAREFGQAWDRAVVTAQDQQGGAPTAPTARNPSPRPTSGS